MTEEAKELQELKEFVKKLHNGFKKEDGFNHTLNNVGKLVGHPGWAALKALQEQSRLLREKPKKPVELHFILGEDAVNKYGWFNIDNPEQDELDTIRQDTQTFNFDTLEEANAFAEGIHEGQGWLEIQQLDDDEYAKLMKAEPLDDEEGDERIEATCKLIRKIVQDSDLRPFCECDEWQQEFSAEKDKFDKPIDELFEDNLIDEDVYEEIREAIDYPPSDDLEMIADAIIELLQ